MTLIYLEEQGSFNNQLKQVSKIILPRCTTRLSGLSWPRNFETFRVFHTDLKPLLEPLQHVRGISNIELRVTRPQAVKKRNIHLQLSLNQIKPFIVLAVVRRSGRRVCGIHIRVIASGQHSWFLFIYFLNVAAVASRCNTVSDLTGPIFGPHTSRSRDECVQAQPTSIRLSKVIRSLSMHVIG